MATRIDKWLWSVRIFKTRTDATDACRNNRITVNGSAAKPSKEIKPGDTITVKKMPVVYTLKVIDVVSNRQPAKNVHLYMENITPQSELDKLNPISGGAFMWREKGTGRPTKKDRREIDEVIEGLFDDSDEEDV